MSIDPVLLEPRREIMTRLGYWRDRTTLDDFQRNLARDPDRVVLVCHDATSDGRRAFSNRQLAREVDAIAGFLVSLGVKKGEVVSYQLPNWWQFVAIHLACLQIGAVTNPLMPIFRRRELTFMLDHGDSVVVFHPSTFRGFDYDEMYREMRGDLPRIRHVVSIGTPTDDRLEPLIAPFRDRPLPAEVTARRAGPNDVIEVLYTSGTTGEPKGVMHTCNTMFANLDPYGERLGLGRDDVFLMASPMAHQTGFMYGMMLPISLDAPTVLLDIWIPTKAAEVIAAEKVTFTMASTPFLTDLTDLAEKDPAPFATLAKFLSSGAPIPRVLVRRATDHLGARIISGWGMSENGAVTLTRLDDPPEKVFETDGCPLPGMEIRVVDFDGTALPAGREGRLQVRGCSNFVGYLKRPQWNATDAEGWFETGDVARMDDDGYIRITGRAKDIIIRGGENIPVVEIEGLLYRHPAVAEVAIVAMPDPRMGERACAFVVPKAGAEKPTLETLTAFLIDNGISKTYLPERLEVVSELPRTQTGKIQKFRLRDVAASFAADAPKR